MKRAPTSIHTGLPRSFSAPEEIRPAAVRTLDPVPVYLIPQVLSAAIRRHGRSIRENRAKLGDRNFFPVTITVQVGAGNE